MKKNGSFSSFLTGFFLKISYFFSEVSDFFHSLPLVFLKTKDLIELNERHYRKEYILQNWEAGVNAGLFPPEEAFIRKFAQQECSVLVIGCGTGRESIALAQKAYRVTAIDSSAAMLDSAQRNIAQADVPVELKLLSLYDIDQLKARFDLVFIGGGYGMIPTKELRRQVLIAIKEIIKPAGAVYLSFAQYSPSKYSSLRYCLYRAIAYFVCGNTKVETGDFIWGTGEFHHCFDSVETVTGEINSAGFLVAAMEKDENALFLKARP